MKFTYSISGHLIRKKNARPNVLVICTDALDGRLVENRNYKKLVELNHISKLQDDGTTFEKTYCDSPICVPSRAALFSGLRTDRTEAWVSVSFETRPVTFVE